MRGFGDERVIPPLQKAPVEKAATSPHLPLSPSPRPRVSLSSLKSTALGERINRAASPEYDNAQLQSANF